ncbi:hypothetical protein HDU67_008625 [Dinochytrium kinnereticum]|nr:hypothetical protein HDU67_008625 [Dinochytrium kinnereticum]
MDEEGSYDNITDLLMQKNGDEFGARLIDDESAHIQYVDSLNSVRERGSLFNTYGFKFCDILNNATFDALSVYISMGLPMEKKSAVKAFVETIDDKAKEISMNLYEKHSYLDIKDLNRFACYLAAEGSNRLAGSASRTMLRRVDPINYFKSILPAITPSTKHRLNKKPHFKVAYTIMVSGNLTVFENFKYLLNELDDGSAAFLLHIDIDSEELYQEISQYLLSRQPERLRLLGLNPEHENNIFIASKRYRTNLGEPSTLVSMLNTFWEFLDIANWDHLINLSVFDVPLRKTREIERLLSLPHNKGRNFVEILDESDIIANMYTQSEVARADVNMDKAKSAFHSPSELGFIIAPQRRWRICRQIYGMILTREYIQYLRESDEATFMLSFFEHSVSPHDGFFCHVLLNTDPFRSNVDKSSRRYFTLEKDRIKMTTMADTRAIGDGEDQREKDNPQFLFALNVDVRQEDGVRLVHWLRENHVEKHQVLWFTKEGVL